MNIPARVKFILYLAYRQKDSVWLAVKEIRRRTLGLLTREESTEAGEDKKTEEKP